jgi:hypothetical protein
MTTIRCPGCGHPVSTDAAVCQKCRHAVMNGTAPIKRTEKPAPPAEASTWVHYPTPPEILAEMGDDFDEEELLTDLRQAETAGLPELKDLIRDLDQEMTRHD